jgi:hypothetical protein
VATLLRHERERVVDKKPLLGRVLWGDERSEYLAFSSFAWGGVLEKLKQVCESGQT